MDTPQQFALAAKQQADTATDGHTPDAHASIACSLVVLNHNLEQLSRAAWSINAQLKAIADDRLLVTQSVGKR